MNNGANLPLWQKAACGLTAGGIGALVGTPADLTLIRMQADATLPVEHRRNYKGVTEAMVRRTQHIPPWHSPAATALDTRSQRAASLRNQRWLHLFETL